MVNTSPQPSPTLGEGNNRIVRVRIAPSPTGNLHVGNARAALFNELFARHEGGTFIVRLEDTDQERSKKEFEDNILEGLKWLGLQWDEGPDIGGEYGPYRQSERTELYTAALNKLLDEGKAKRGEGETIVLEIEPQEIIFHDKIRGDVRVHTDNFGGSFIIARSLTNPVFHLAVVVDDAAMGITHVIRGEDHLHNTAKHILIQRALGYETPIYAHLPLLLDEKRAKLSKRSGETNLLAYRDMGYLPQAMLNYLALLGWNPKNDKEFFTHEELIEAFSLSGVQKAGAIFSLHKLDAINKHYLNTLSEQELIEWGKAHYILHNIPIEDDGRFLAALQTERSRLSSYITDGKELHEVLAWYSSTWEAEYDPTLLVWRKSDAQTTVSLVEKLLAKMHEMDDHHFTAEKLQEILMAWIDAEQLGRGDTLWPLRVALTGREHSPGPFEIGAVIGKEEMLRRLKEARVKLKEIV